MIKVMEYQTIGNPGSHFYRPPPIFSSQQFQIRYWAFPNKREKLEKENIRPILFANAVFDSVQNCDSYKIILKWNA